MAADERDTEGLAGGARAGDPEAFAALVERIRGRLETWIRVRMGPLLRSRLALDDVFQETLIQAHRSLGDFREKGPGSFQRWLFSVAENRLKDLHKYHAAQKRHPGHEAELRPRGDEEHRLVESLAAHGTSPSEGARRTEFAERLAEVLGTLPEDAREVVVLRLIEEQPFPEIAARLGRDVRVVRGLYARGLRAVQVAWSPGAASLRDGRQNR